ncbi:MAG: 6-phosphofructokinase [Patescibacteria group bacterium]|nr:6-phosphofructokinase [Patescibacteria group bacterium]MDD4304380.1 6-phosphofructokinase [Patescibacteria group bacterium]MDD4695403.1 6-phosphofructokinase [Patescibacteria group bacterium]
MKNKTILVFTGGGITSALNPTLYGILKEAKKYNIKVLGGLYGWRSVLNNGKMVDISNIYPEIIKNRGGSFLKSSRTNPFGDEGNIDEIKLNLKEKNIDAIIAIGGNDTLGAANRLFKEEKINIVAIPKTIDNDLSGTYYCPGFASAAHYFSEYVKEIKYDAAYSLSRVFIIEGMGQDAAWLTASACYGGADIIIPPEKKVNFKKVIKVLLDKYEKNGNYAVLVVGEKAQFDINLKSFDFTQNDDYNVKRKNYISIGLQEEIKKYMGNVTVKALYPGNYLQTGPATKIDSELSIKLGKEAIKLVRQKIFGKMANIIRKGNKLEISNIELSKTTKFKSLNNKYFNWDKFEATKEYFEYMKPILGKYKDFKNDPYYKLTKKINS